MFADKLLANFKVNPSVKNIISQWAEKMTELLVFGLPKDQWAIEIYQLHRYCQRNKLPQFTSFDPLNQFSAFMEEWRSIVINNKRKAVANEFPSLTEMLLDNLNLNLACEGEMQKLEERLIQQIKAGTKLEYSISQVRNFCRSHAGEKGFYDERGQLNYLVGVWYDIVNEASLPFDPIELATEDDTDFDVIMQDIDNYVNQNFYPEAQMA